jgi:hypothetical protein
MKREFRKENNKRYVKAKIQNHVIYHPECAPDYSKQGWAGTNHSCCGKCYEALYKAIK